MTARRGSALCALTGALFLLSSASAGAAGPPTGFQVRQVDLANYPTVHLVVRSPRAGQQPPVFADGKPVSGAAIQNLGGTKAIVLAIDRSESMRGGPLGRATAAAAGFLGRKRQTDEVAVVSFGPHALAQTSFGQATIDADNALGTLATAREQGTALYDAVVLSASELRRQGITGRVLVLLTDGRDVGSVATLADAVEAVKRAHVVVYAIALGHADKGSLARLAHASGGALYLAATSETLSSVYRRIADEFGRTWRISFTTSARPGDRLLISTGRAGPSQSVVVPGHAAPQPGGLLPSGLVRSTGGALLVTLLAAVLLFFVVQRARAIPPAERIRRLVQAHTQTRTRQAKGRQRPTFASALAAVDRALKRGRGKRWEQLERVVGQAGMPVSASTLVLTGAAAGAAFALIAALAGTSGFVVLLFFVAGLAAPLVAARVIAKRRVSAFDDQLPEILSTIASTLRVGHGLKAGLQAIADDGPQPASGELRRVLAEARLGRPLDEALIAMCERLGSDDLLYVATAVDVQSRVGGSLAGVFETVAETVRSRKQHRRKMRALTASGRASAIVLSILPFVLVGLVALVNPNYMLPFLRSSTGQFLIILSIISISIGAFLLSRIANVKG